MNIALLGYGKMGKAIEEIALQKGHNIILRIHDQNLDELTTANLQQADVAIEFTSPQSAVHNILLCFGSGVPVVCGTTGWLKEMEMVQQKCKELGGTFLYASNFSIGVNIFFELNKKLAELMKHQVNYNVSMEEIHHTEKKDAPSGTAITLAEEIIKISQQKNKWVNHFSDVPNELSITSKRIDPAAGTHSVKYSSDVDDIEIIHTAHNRKGFAAGAVLAAEFIFNKKGVFSMKDVLNF
ncbi:4-hydroxy-tetrahydrodipicolinate reductase [Ginsengibacter hankyongi]|uniref:4-hydroxy-tetrahydrodipicolinate reductase n=1 Tax=Ginsengibacter hankyongi TaxID=2607284 RepID=A0A5J5IJ93_9BACT|nr:4-hydroxy-tetrahydrodipicolinate reductase [Ginsengibacter hankyongi]KAA9041135.1 4-hydroxy-tetrahydrodipicolinate reductase [Ginsengibacter hankyongi]